MAGSGANGLKMKGFSGGIPGTATQLDNQFYCRIEHYAAEI